MTTWQTLPFAQTPPSAVIFPRQTHSVNIREIRAGDAAPVDCDGLWTRDASLLLGVCTADCAPIVFITADKFGVIHCGWRGLVGGIIENMLLVAGSDAQFFIGAFYPQFIIQRDFCYDAIAAKFGEQFFCDHADGVEFDFLAAIKSLLPAAQWSGDNTFTNPQFASWRRQAGQRPLPAQNATIVGNFTKI